MTSRARTDRRDRIGNRIALANHVYPLQPQLFVPRTASDRPGAVVIAVARACPRMARVVITIAVS
jgi:hypothetical protein